MLQKHSQQLISLKECVNGENLKSEMLMFAQQTCAVEQKETHLSKLVLQTIVHWADKWQFLLLCGNNHRCKWQWLQCQSHLDMERNWQHLVDFHNLLIDWNKFTSNFLFFIFIFTLSNWAQVHSLEGTQVGGEPLNLPSVPHLRDWCPLIVNPWLQEKYSVPSQGALPDAGSMCPLANVVGRRFPPREQRTPGKCMRGKHFCLRNVVIDKIAGQVR